MLGWGGKASAAPVDLTERFSLLLGALLSETESVRLSFEPDSQKPWRVGTPSSVARAPGSPSCLGPVFPLSGGHSLGTGLHLPPCPGVPHGPSGQQ